MALQSSISACSGSSFVGFLCLRGWAAEGSSLKRGRFDSELAEVLFLSCGVYSEDGHG